MRFNNFATGAEFYVGIKLGHNERNSKKLKILENMNSVSEDRIAIKFDNSPQNKDISDINKLKYSPEPFKYEWQQINSKIENFKNSEKTNKELLDIIEGYKQRETQYINHLKQYEEENKFLKTTVKKQFSPKKKGKEKSDFESQALID